MKLKLLKEQNSWANINLIELLSNKYDKTPTKKLTPLLIKLIKSSLTNDDIETIKVWLTEKVFKADEYVWDRFCEHLEFGRLTNSDVTSYSSLEEITNAVNLADFKLLEKNLSKEINVVYEDDEWFLLKPLTLESSVKYGYGTKWCTASKDHSEPFYEYSSRGILIYIINKVTGVKHGFYKDSYNSVSFWNSVDERVDSLLVGLSEKVVKILLDEVKNSKNNYEYFSEEEKNKRFSYNLKYSEYEVGVEAKQAVPTNYNIDGYDDWR
jgi:hypothetical protein